MKVLAAVCLFMIIVFSESRNSTNNIAAVIDNKCSIELSIGCALIIIDRRGI